MIGYLKGKVIDKTKESILLDVQGVGYLVFFNKEIAKNEIIELQIYHHIREDQNALYGFKTTKELNFFKLLLTVSGVGPKMAMTIISNLSAKSIKDAIESNRSEIFRSVSGVGSKVANKIILELKSKISKEEFDFTKLEASDKLVDSLISLGLTKGEIITTVKHLPSDIFELNEQIKWVLKNIGKKFDTDEVK